MGDILEFKRPRPLKGFIPEPINLAEPITADKFKAGEAFDDDGMPSDSPYGTAPEPA